MQGSVAVGAARQAPRNTGAAKGFPFFFSVTGDLAKRRPVSVGTAREGLAEYKYWEVLYGHRTVAVLCSGGCKSFFSRLFYFCPVKYPQDKINKWSGIDQKLIAKYSANQDKDRKYRNKQKGLANYMLVRHADQCLLLKTEGREIEVTDPDHWQDVRAEPYYFRYGS